MARNIAIKARTDQFDELLERAEELTADTPISFRQHEFFYDVPAGRLKLCQFDCGTPAELIFYRRDERDAQKSLYYSRSPVTNPDAMHVLLEQALTTRGIVSKERHVFYTGRTRIHLDRVDGLGDFVELEVLLEDDEDEMVGEAEAHAILEKLGIAQSDVVPFAYVDLLRSTVPERRITAQCRPRPGARLEKSAP
jgi:adenylate cyclase class IV